MFDNVVYLNRDQDTDRRETTEKQFLNHGIKATRFAALNHDTLQDFIVEPVSSLGMNTAQISCLVSHLEIVRLYGNKELLVFEDDIDISTEDYWGCSFKDILSCVDESIGIVQMYAFPTPDLITPRWWSPGTFSTGAYFIRPWYAQKLIDTGYRGNKWEVNAFPTKYVQRVADSVLYSSTPTVSLTLFSSLPRVSTILPHASYANETARYGNSWKTGENNIEDVKKALKKFTV